MKFFDPRHIAATAALALLASVPASALELTFGHGLGPGSPRYEGAEKFKELVEARTDGRITIVHAPQATVGDDTEMLTALQLGTLAFTANGQGPVSNIVPEFAALGLPFLFDDLPSAWRVLDGPVGAELTEKAAEKGLVMLAYWDNGIRYISNNLRPIQKPEDLRGMNLRTPPAPIMVDLFKALGANPQPLAFSEVYLALEQGVFDGQENPASTIYTAKFYEVQKYVSKTGHAYEAAPVIASKVIWDTLSPEDQDIIRQAALDAGKYERDLTLNSDDMFLEKLSEEGVEVNDVDKEPFREATAPVYNKWRAELGDFVTRLHEAATAN